MARPWRNCNASLTLLSAVNSLWPHRDKASDGTIGDAEHATRDSDHNPWVVDANGIGVVRARDTDVDGIDAAWLAERLRLLGAAGDRRLIGGGYVIFNRRITKPDFSGWLAYHGINPHTSHIHTSFSRDAAGYDSSAPWNLEGDDLSGYGENINKMLTGADAPSMNLLKPGPDGKIPVPPGMDPDGMAYGLADVRYALTTFIPEVKKSIGENAKAFEALTTALQTMSTAITAMAADIQAIKDALSQPPAQQ